MLALFLDESGDHNLVRIDPQYPLFVLGGILADRNYAFSSLQESVDRFKGEIFGKTRILLHTSDITRNRNGFEFLQNSDKRRNFYKSLNALVEGLDFEILAVAIDKEKHVTTYGRYALDPYHFSLRVVVERFVYALRTRRTKGVIYAEARGSDLDEALRSEWARIRREGTGFVKGEHVVRNIEQMKIVPKRQNIAALQVADLVLSPLARYVLGRTRTPDMEICLRKLRRGPQGQWMGYGLIKLPR